MEVDDDVDFEDVVEIKMMYVTMTRSLCVGQCGHVTRSQCVGQCVTVTRSLCVGQCVSVTRSLCVGKCEIFPKASRLNTSLRRVGVLLASPAHPFSVELVSREHHLDTHQQLAAV